MRPKIRKLLNDILFLAYGAVLIITYNALIDKEHFLRALFIHYVVITPWCLYAIYLSKGKSKEKRLKD